MIHGMAVWMLTLFLLNGYGAVWADSGSALLEDLTSGQIDWSGAEIQTTGRSQPKGEAIDPSERGRVALSEAKEKARHHMSAAIKSMQLDCTATVGEFLGGTRDLMAGLQEMVNATPISSQMVLSDGTVTVVLKMGLPGGLSQMILPPDIQQISAIKTQPPANTVEPEEVSDGSGAAKPDFTGFLFDTRGLEIKTALVPTIRDEKGQEVYGKSFVSRDFAVQWGVCRYARDPGHEAILERVGPNPLVIKTLKTADVCPSDLVISLSDAARIKRKSGHLGLLRQGRVAIWVD